MYLVVIAWIYVVLMMSIAEATNTTGTVLGALITFVLYGALPVTLVVYLMGAPARSKAIKKRDAAERAEAVLKAEQAQANPADADAGASDSQTPPSVDPDAGGHPARRAEAVATDASAGIAAVRKEP